MRFDCNSIKYEFTSLSEALFTENVQKKEENKKLKSHKHLSDK